VQYEIGSKIPAIIVSASYKSLITGTNLPLKNQLISAYIATSTLDSEYMYSSLDVSSNEKTLEVVGNWV
jgi:hypothetical protein